ncbi:MAG: peptide chain release factor 1, partial [Bacillota bacterium]
MLARLAKMYQRHQELEQQLADPKIISDHRKLQSLGKEHASLTAASEAYVSYQALATEIKQTEELVQEEADDELHELAKEELRALKAQEAMLTEQIKILLLPKDPNDDKNIILEIRGAVGGDEAALFAAVLYRMYVRFAERHGWTTEVLSLNDTGIGGLKEAIISIQGKGVFRELKYESGAHRVQRVPTTESGGRLHTSTATVAVLPEVAEVELTIHEKDIRVDTFCSSGPGGQ